MSINLKSSSAVAKTAIGSSLLAITVSWAPALFSCFWFRRLSHWGETFSERMGKEVHSWSESKVLGYHDIEQIFFRKKELLMRIFDSKLTESLIKDILNEANVRKKKLTDFPTVVDFYRSTSEELRSRRLKDYFMPQLVLCFSVNPTPPWLEKKTSWRKIFQYFLFSNYGFWR